MFFRGIYMYIYLEHLWKVVYDMPLNKLCVFVNLIKISKIEPWEAQPFVLSFLHFCVS